MGLFFDSVLSNLEVASGDASDSAEDISTSSLSVSPPSTSLSTTPSPGSTIILLAFTLPPSEGDNIFLLDISTDNTPRRL